MNPLSVAFIDQVGAAPGGAEQTLLTFLKHAPPGIRPVAILFEDGPFADRLRGLDIAVDVVDVAAAIRSSTREQLQIRGALGIPATALKVAALLRRRAIDVAYTNSMKAHVVGAVAARMAGVPCVMHFHDIVGGAALTALRGAARLGSRERIACSQTVSDTINVGTTTVIYAPIELDGYAALPAKLNARKKLRLPLDGPIVSIVGRINRWKGHDRFLRMAATVAGKVPAAHFAIVGAPIFRDADFVPELEHQVDELGLRGRVTFVPWLDDVRDIYAATDVNCNCSTREPFGRAAIEAAACGVPTVCFDDSGASETIIDHVTGRAIPAGDEGSFADAVTRYLRDPAMLLGASSAARLNASRFDAPRIADEMTRVIRRAAA
jgi:glycosyltransferase involved in cell wall biosynthesis